MSQVRPSGVLFLDIASNVGWAFGTDLLTCPKWGVWQLAPDWDIGRKAMCFDNELAFAIKTHNPEFVCCEAPLPASKQKSGDAAEVLIGLVVLAEGTCCRWDRKLERISSGTIRAGVCGRAHRNDEELRQHLSVKDAIVLPWIQSMGWGAITSHDARDAAAGVAYRLGYRHVRPARPGKKVVS